MWDLFSSLEIGRRALSAQQAALQVTSNNIANVNTPGYHRQRAVLEPTPAEPTPIGPLGTGVTVTKIEAARDRFLEYRIGQVTQGVGRDEAIAGYLGQVETVLGTSESGVQEGITRFFNSFSALSADATSIPLRYGVISAAANLSATFRNAAGLLADVRSSANSAVTDTVREINTLTGTIAKLNAQIAGAELGGADANTLRDQRSVALNELSKTLDIHYYEADDGAISVATAAGATLVTAGFAQALTATTTGPDGIVQIQAGLNDITNSIRDGKLGGLLEARDRLIPAYQQQLDTLAESIISQVNAVHAGGSDLQIPPSSTAIDFFVPAASVTGAAAAFSLNPTVAGDARSIAAGQSGSPGDNANAIAIAGLAFQKTLAGGTETFSEAFGSLQFRVGTDTQSASSRLSTSNALLVQLENSRDAASGVSLDEEAIDLLRFQRAYQAAARYINVVDQLTEELIHTLGN
ncbi:MAG TPA: flagellar hook-associated protein FlgK [Terriglobia bacterium]|nr:flagellar hook-associated protein FlgK [Terriglobia bacterium]